MTHGGDKKGHGGHEDPWGGHDGGHGGAEEGDGTPGDTPGGPAPPCPAPPGTAPHLSQFVQFDVGLELPKANLRLEEGRRHGYWENWEVLGGVAPVPPPPYWFILVHTTLYWFILVCSGTQQGLGDTAGGDWEQLGSTGRPQSKMLAYSGLYCSILVYSG